MAHLKYGNDDSTTDGDIHRNDDLLSTRHNEHPRGLHRVKPDDGAHTYDFKYQHISNAQVWQITKYGNIIRQMLYKGRKENHRGKWEGRGIYTPAIVPLGLPDQLL
jgi:hypothetical protein